MSPSPVSTPCTGPFGPKSLVFTIVLHANPHLASFACGGLSAEVPGVNVSDFTS